MTSEGEQDQNKLAEVIRQMSESNNNQAAASFLTIDLPKFYGKPNEDLDTFLVEYNIKTSTLSNNLKCSMIQRALMGDALLWFLHNNKIHEENSWQNIVTALRERFASGDRKQRKLEKLNTMKFNPLEKTLTSYIESFVSLYRAVYPGSEVKPILEHLDLNLPKNVRFALNVTDQDWINKDLDSFYELIRRIETKVLPLQEPDESERDLAKRSDIEAVLKQLASITEKMTKPPTESPKEVAAVAAIMPPRIDQANYNPATTHQVQGNNYNYDRNNNYYPPRGRAHLGRGQRGGYRGRNNDRFVPYYRGARMNNRNNAPMLPQNRQRQLALAPPPANYQARTSDPQRRIRTRPCLHCQGEHWDSECQARNAKDQRSSN